jgi:hypothetical protein
MEMAEHCSLIDLSSLLMTTRQAASLPADEPSVFILRSVLRLSLEIPYCMLRRWAYFGSVFLQELAEVYLPERGVRLRSVLNGF